jgi:hypothetical protein
VVTPRRTHAKNTHKNIGAAKTITALFCAVSRAQPGKKRGLGRWENVEAKASAQKMHGRRTRVGRRSLGRAGRVGEKRRKEEECRVIVSTRVGLTGHKSCVFARGPITSATRFLVSQWPDGLLELLLPKFFLLAALLLQQGHQKLLLRLQAPRWGDRRTRRVRGGRRSARR